MIRKPFLPGFLIHAPLPAHNTARGSLPLPRARGQKGLDWLQTNALSSPAGAKASGAFCGPRPANPGGTAMFSHREGKIPQVALMPTGRHRRDLI